MCQPSFFDDLYTNIVYFILFCANFVLFLAIFAKIRKIPNFFIFFVLYPLTVIKLNYKLIISKKKKKVAND